VGDLVTGRHPDAIMQHVIHGPIDADQLDYLRRDSYFTGISHGQIDIYRILHTLKADKALGRLYLMEKGLDAIEEMLVARDHMYSAVYSHKAGRIAETMLLRAMELAVSEIEGWYEMTDGELLTRLRAAGGVSGRLVERIIFRELFKTAFSISSRGDEDERQVLGGAVSQMSREEVEALLTERCGFGPGELIVDMPADVLAFSEPRLGRMELAVLRKSGEWAGLEEMSVLAQALSSKVSSHVVFAVYTEPDNVMRARAVTEAWLGI
jgi:hypothetical protein